MQKYDIFTNVPQWFFSPKSVNIAVTLLKLASNQECKILQQYLALVFPCDKYISRNLVKCTSESHMPYLVYANAATSTFFSFSPFFKLTFAKSNLIFTLSQNG